MSTILHLSDVHFGPPHRTEVADAVLELEAERAPDVVVISGDLTQRARPEQFAAARRWVDRLAAPVVVVPGNHDVPLYRVWERFGAPYGAYRRHFADTLEPLYQGNGLYIAGVNTAHGWTFKGGRVSRRQLERLEARLRAAPTGSARVVVAHHPVVHAPSFRRQRPARNARAFVELLGRNQVELVLSGHLHQGFEVLSEEFYPAAGGPVVIVHAGTSTSSRGRGAERDRNTLNWVRIEADRLEVERLCWEPGEGSFRSLGRHLFPRRHAVPA